MSQKDDKKSIFDGKLFTLIDEDEKGNIKAKCMLCPKNKEYSGQGTGNFHKHLKRSHPSAKVQYNEAKKKKDGPPLREFAESPKSAWSFGKKCTQEEASKAITNFVIKCSQPVSIVEKEPFKELVGILSSGACKSINRKALVSRIDKVSVEHFDQVKAELKKADHICTTADIWSNRKKSFIGVTAHIIDNETFERKSFALACERFTGTHDYKAIAEKIDGIHGKFDLSSDKVVRVVTDNASNFGKAFKIFGMKDIECENGETIDLEDPLENENDIEFIDFASVLDEDDNESTTDGHGIEADVSQIELPMHETCKAHTASLIATVDIGKAKFKPEHLRIKNQAFGKATALWNKVNYPGSSEIIVEIFGRSLVTPVVTRWNSLNDSLKCLLSFDRDTINAALTRLNIPLMTEVHYEFLKEYLKVLSPIAIALDKFQAENNCYYGSVVPILRQLKIDLEKLKTEESKLKYTSPILNCALGGLEKRLKHFLDQDEAVPHLDHVNMEQWKKEWFAKLTKNALLATISNPNFRSKHIHKDKRQHVENLLLEEAIKMSKKSGREEETEEVRDEYFDLSDDEDTDENVDNTRHAVSIEVSQFLSDKDSALKMLHKYPSVKQVFMKYNTPITSSAPVERLFSFASIIINGRRGRLSDKNFENLCLMKANSC